MSWSRLLAQIKASLTLTRDSILSQRKDLGDANECKHNQVMQDEKSSSMNMLSDNLEYAFNKQSQMYLEIKACESIRTRLEYSIYHLKNPSS